MYMSGSQTFKCLKWSYLFLNKMFQVKYRHLKSTLDSICNKFYLNKITF